jgi:hypothetical protein
LQAFRFADRFPYPTRAYLLVRKAAAQGSTISAKPFTCSA